MDNPTLYLLKIKILQHTSIKKEFSCDRFNEMRLACLYDALKTKNLLKLLEIESASNGEDSTLMK